MKRTLNVAASILVLFAICVPAFAKDHAKPAGHDYILYVGTYTIGEDHQPTASKGIYAYRVSEDKDSIQLTSLGLEAETPNPSFLAADPSQHLLYAVNELAKYKGSDSGAVTAYAIDPKSGKLTYLNEVASRGADPCYISFDKTGKYALVANYTGGSVAVFPVLGDGRVGEASAFVQHTGSGARPDRQEGPHAHWIETTSDNRFAIAADLGLDKLLVYRFDATNGSLAPNSPAFVKLDPGTGPRHVAFAPNNNYVYVVDELNSTINGFTYDSHSGILSRLQTISTLPKGFSGSNDTAEIHVHPNGKFLFASNRGHDSIAVFGIDQHTGNLTLVDHFATVGRTPRNFEIDPSGRFLLVANQDSGNIAVFRIDEKSGRLTTTGQILNVPSPVSLRFVAAE